MGYMKTLAEEFPLGTKPAPSPMILTTQYVTIDISSVRWLWWPAILYLFWAMAFICDEYFVRTIEVISERFQIPDDVAGATLMALGCNGPELALNCIAIFSPSNVGVGAVVGGEVFNVLVIIGTALLATPDVYMPLKLEFFMFLRDILFYIFSLAVLYWVLADGEVSRVDSFALLLGAVLYTATVSFSSQLCKFLSKDAKVLLRVLTRGMSQAKLRLPSPTSSRHSMDFQGTSADAEGDSDLEGPDPEMLAHWEQARTHPEPSGGCVLGVRVEVRNRLMDRGRHVEDRYIWLREDALLVSTAVDPRSGKHLVGDVVYDHAGHPGHNQWHHGGLVNQPVFLGEQGTAYLRKGNAEPASHTGTFPAVSTSELAQPLLNEAAPKPKSKAALAQGSPPPFRLPGFRDVPWEVIPLEDILYCERGDDPRVFNIHVHQHNRNSGNLITLELTTKEEPEVMDAWMETLRAKLKEQRRQILDAAPTKTPTDLLIEWVNWLQFPVKFFVSLTIPDMDDPKRHHLYPVSFFMCMFWLATCAYAVVKACDGIHDSFGIPVGLLGFTVAAAGTSLPNVFSGMCVARQGKTSMAIANALGANVQNVFIALAVPWTIRSCFVEGGPFPMVVEGLIPAVFECAITLVPVILVYMSCSCSLPRWSGVLFLLTYAIYVIRALGQQVSGCPTWPVPLLAT